MLDDKDEFAAFTFERCGIRTLRTLRESAARRLVTKEFDLSHGQITTEEELKTLVRDIDDELSVRSICNVCWNVHWHGLCVK